MCPVTIGAAALGTTVSGAAAAGTTALAAGLGMAAIGTAVTGGLAIMQMNQAASQAQAQMNFQAQSQQAQLDMTRQQMQLQQDQQYQAQVLAQQQQTEQYNLNVLQANNSIANQWRQQRQQVQNERQAILKKYEGDRVGYQRSVELAREQIGLNNEAANRVYSAEQIKLMEAKKKAAFESQAILAKAIGARGSILATGRSGQSVGLLLKDVERQKGFAQAQADATFSSKRAAAIVAMEGGWLSAQSANAKAQSQIQMFPQDPYLPKDPDTPTFVNPIGLAIDNPIPA